MVDDFAVQDVRSSGELWSEICSSLPEVRDEASEEKKTEFKDCFQPAAPVNGQWDGTNTSPTTAKWEPMEDSDIYIASLGAHFLPLDLKYFYFFLQNIIFSYNNLSFADKQTEAIVNIHNTWMLFTKACCFTINKQPLRDLS